MSLLDKRTVLEEEVFKISIRKICICLQKNEDSSKCFYIKAADFCK